MDVTLVLVGDLECLCAIACDQNGIPLLDKQVPSQLAERFFIFHEQDRLEALQGTSRVLVYTSLLEGRVHPRQVDLERGACSRLAINPDVSATLLDHTVDNSKS